MVRAGRDVLLHNDARLRLDVKHGSPRLEGDPLNFVERLKRWARRFENEVHALYLACGDPRVPWYARVLAVCVVGYALSPIDLIPDLIPVLGYLDDLILIPLGLALAIRLIPDEVLEEYRREAREAQEVGAAGRVAAVVVVCVWVLVAVLLFRVFWA